jgi:hypothetical protein
VARVWIVSILSGIVSIVPSNRGVLVVDAIRVEGGL